MLLFNSGDGYSEAIVRGYKLGLISSNQYSNLSQCETIDGRKDFIFLALSIFL